MNSTDFQTGSLQKMDPTAVFVHHDRKCQTLADRTWQKLNIDRVSQCSFDSSGRFCAVHYSYNAIEIWDFTSIPVPITTLLVPKIASGRGDGFCYNLTWSPCNTFLIGVFGSKFVNQRKAEGSTSEDTTTTQVYRPYHMVVWNVKQRVLTHAIRLPFGVKSIHPLSALPTESKYLVTSAHSNGLFELDLLKASIRHLTFDPLFPTTLTRSAAWELHNALDTEEGVSSIAAAPCDVPIDAFAAWWFDKCDNFKETHACIDSVPSSAVHVNLAHNALFITHHTLHPQGSCELYSVTFEHNVYTIQATTTLSIPGQVLSITTDPHYTLLCVTTANGMVHIYTTVLVLLGEKLPTDRELTDLMNTHTSTVSRTLTLDHKKSLPVVYSYNTEYKCVGATFYTYTVPYNTDNTRYSNNLTHHELLYPSTSTSTNNTTTSTTSTNTNSTNLKHNTTNTKHHTNNTTNTSSIGSSTDSTGRVTHRTGVLYSVQSHIRGSSTSGRGHNHEHILFDLHFPSGTSSTTTGTDTTLSAEEITHTSSTTDTTKNTATDVTTANSDNVEIKNEGSEYTDSTSVATTNTHNIHSTHSTHGTHSTYDAYSTNPTTASISKILTNGVVAARLSRTTTTDYFVSPLQSTSLYTSHAHTTHAHTTHTAITTNSTHTSPTQTHKYTAYKHSMHPRALPRQTLLTIDDAGRLWCLSPHCTSDFPGPMYPIGYTLVTKVVQYVETEEELDVVVGGTSTGNTAQITNNTLTAGASSADTSATNIMDVYSGSDEPVAKRARLHSSDNTNTTTTGGLSIVDLAVRRVPSTTTTSTTMRGVLPFTFADDYLRIAVNGTGTTGGTSGGTGGRNGTNSTGGANSNSTTGGGRGLGRPPAVRKQNITAITNSTNSTGYSGGAVCASPLAATSSANTHSDATSNTSSTDEGMDVVHSPINTLPTTTSTTTTNTTSTTTSKTTSAVWSMEDFITAPVRVQSGDFEAKLARIAAGAEVISAALQEPHRAAQRITQITEEAVFAVVHAEEMKEKGRLKLQARKEQKEAVTRPKRGEVSDVGSGGVSSRGGGVSSKNVGGVSTGGVDVRRVEKAHVNMLAVLQHQQMTLAQAARNAQLASAQSPNTLHTNTHTHTSALNTPKSDLSQRVARHNAFVQRELMSFAYAVKEAHPEIAFTSDTLKEAVLQLARHKYGDQVVVGTNKDGEKTIGIKIAATAGMFGSSSGGVYGANGAVSNGSGGGVSSGGISSGSGVSNGMSGGVSSGGGSSGGVSSGKVYGAGSGVVSNEVRDTGAGVASYTHSSTSSSTVSVPPPHPSESSDDMYFPATINTTYTTPHPVTYTHKVPKGKPKGHNGAKPILPVHRAKVSQMHTSHSALPMHSSSVAPVSNSSVGGVHSVGSMRAPLLPNAVQPLYPHSTQQLTVVNGVIQPVPTYTAHTPHSAQGTGSAHSVVNGVYENNQSYNTQAHSTHAYNTQVHNTQAPVVAPYTAPPVPTPHSAVPGVPVQLSLAEMLSDMLNNTNHNNNR